jgi:hypothetical protein
MQDMPIANEYLPVNHQDIDDMYEEDLEELEELDASALAVQAIRDPSITANMRKETLSKIYGALEVIIKEFEAGRVEIKKAVFDLMDTDSEQIGDYLFYNMRRARYVDLDIETAIELGLAEQKWVKNTKAIKQAVANGLDVGKIEYDTIPVAKFKGDN